MRERTRLEKRITGYDMLVRELDENTELIELAEAEGDKDGNQKPEKKKKRFIQKYRKTGFLPSGTGFVADDEEEEEEQEKKEEASI